MTRTTNKIRAEGTAWRLTRDYCMEVPGPVPAEDIAMDNGVLCLEGPLTGCLARLVRKGKRGIIRTQAGIREDGRRRFAVAHELGHWFLHEGESQMIFRDTSEQLRDYKGSPMEVEANLFASELLMPSFLFRPLAENAEPILGTVRDLAGLFATSLTATGMKFVGVNRHECILVLSKNGIVAWSKQKGARSGLRIEKGMTLHPDSLAYHVRDPRRELGPEQVPSEAWIGQNCYDRKIEVTEQSWSLDGYQSILTLLVIVDTDGEDADDMVQHYERKNQVS